MPQVTTRETDVFLLASLKEIRRSGKFKQIGAALSSFKPPTTDLDYHTGKESEFDMQRGDAQNRPLENFERGKTEIPFGPEFKTPQWERTVKK